MSDAVPIKMALADAVRAYGIRAACRESGVPRPTVMRWLRGGGGITFAQAEALARAVGISISIRWPEAVVRRAVERCLAKPLSDLDERIARDIIENFESGVSAADIATAGRWFDTSDVLNDFVKKYSGLSVVGIPRRPRHGRAGRGS